MEICDSTMKYSWAACPRARHCAALVLVRLVPIRLACPRPARQKGRRPLHVLRPKGKCGVVLGKEGGGGLQAEVL